STARPAARSGGSRAPRARRRGPGLSSPRPRTRLWPGQSPSATRRIGRASVRPGARSRLRQGVRPRGGKVGAEPWLAMLARHELERAAHRPDDGGMTRWLAVALGAFPAADGQLQLAGHELPVRALLTALGLVFLAALLRRFQPKRRRRIKHTLILFGLNLLHG